MNAEKRSLLEILAGPKQLIIPVFQRDYSWTESECEQLWSDILRVGAAVRSQEHFLGSVVAVTTSGSGTAFGRWLIVDGQQRVTSVTLLLAALRDHLIETNWSGGDDSPSVRKIEDNYLLNQAESEARRHKLILRRKDQEELASIVARREADETRSGRISENYWWFKDRLRETDPEIVYRGLSRLAAVDVTLKQGEDDPQAIFESLNTTGMELSQADLIRNYLLMGFSDEVQTELYSNFWSRIEAQFGRSSRGFDNYLRDYLALKVKAARQFKSDQIYFEFRRHYQSVHRSADKVRELLKDMSSCAKYYSAFINGRGGPELAKQAMANLRTIVDVPAILVMKLLQCHGSNNALSDQELCKSMALLNSYITRRAVCELQTRGYWQIFSGLSYNIDEQRPFRSLLEGLAMLPESYAFPSDEQFQSALISKDLFPKRVDHHLLSQFENYGSREPSDTTNYSVEHIMPKTERLSASWRQMLGDDWKRVHATWKHRLGNLTLTGYNSTYSTRPFEEKKSIPNGFADSSIRLNKFIREQRVWTEAEMSQRARLLADKALEIWPALDVDPTLLSQARQTELVRRSERRDVSRVPMSPKARELFDQLRPLLKSMGVDVIEIAEPRSVSYHAPNFFVEVLPRKNRINLLLALDFNEAKDVHGIAEDATEWRFLIFAQHEGGVNIRISSREDIDRALPLLRQAHQIAAHDEFVTA